MLLLQAKIWNVLKLEYCVIDNYKVYLKKNTISQKKIK